MNTLEAAQNSTLEGFARTIAAATLRTHGPDGASRFADLVVKFVQEGARDEKQQ